jgi:hypothetical protein
MNDERRGILVFGSSFIVHRLSFFREGMMFVCPMCKKALPNLSRQCPRCRTDLALLVDYVDALQDGLAHADACTRHGELGEAVWAYLEVLEVDPDNPIARRQVSQVVTAVRQFDRAAPGRRWLSRLQRQARFRQWLHAVQTNPAKRLWLSIAGLALLGLVTFALGFSLGRRTQAQISVLEPSATVLPQ